MPDLPTLIGSRISLRPPRETDAEAMVALGQDAEVAKGFGLMPDSIPPLDLGWAKGWLAELAGGYGWIIARQDAPIGSIRLLDVWRREGHASVAMGLQSSRDVGRGYGREALSCVLAYAFEDLGLHRVGLRVMATNLAAIRCYRACGFVEEGREREAAWSDSGRVDNLVMGVLRTEWEAAP